MVVETVARDSVNEVWESIAYSHPKESGSNEDEYPIGVDEEGEWYEWVLSRDRQAEYSLFRILRAVRHSIKQLPKTKSTFSSAEMCCLPTTNFVPSELYEVCGAWPVPDFYSTGSSQRSVRYANPRNPNAAYFTDVFTRCECGCLVTYDNRPGDKVDEQTDHSSSCLRQWRLRARARLLEKRKEVAERLLLLGHTLGGRSDRLGYRNRSSMGATKEEIGIREEEFIERRKDIEARTFARLSHYYDHDEIADAFGYSRKTIGERINYRTDTSGLELRNFRREYGYE